MCRCPPPVSNRKTQSVFRCNPRLCHRRAARFPALPARRSKDTLRAREFFPCPPAEVVPRLQAFSSPALPCLPELPRDTGLRTRTRTPAKRTKKSPRISSWELLEKTTELLFDAILQQILQLAHEFLHVLEVHVHRCKPHVGDFIQFLQPVHNHLANFRGGLLE